MNPNRPFIYCALLLVSLWFCPESSRAGDFFSVVKVERQDAPVEPKKKNGKVIGPRIVAKVETKDAIRGDTLYGKAYFFDDRGTLLASAAVQPSNRPSRDGSSMPVIFQKQKPESLAFPIPQKLIAQKWKVVVVFGDEHEAVAASYPAGMPMGIDYPEKKIVDGSAGSIVKRQVPLDPLIQYVATTSNPKQSKITLLLRTPDGVTDASQLQGVMALCLLGNSVDDMKRQLQQINIGSDVKNMINFANSHKLAILCWGAGPVIWAAGANHDQISKQANQQYDKAFDQVADGWERGVKELQQKYGLPDHNYLLVGVCVSAQWAHRLAVRKPDYFLAAYIHEPTSFDAPTPEASKILWLVTDGELDYGYGHAIGFYKDCCKLGYPMIFKPIVHLGHSRSPIAENLANKFFEYALSVKGQREAFDKAQKDPLAKISQKSLATQAKGPWLESFRTPEFYGDYLNQECYPANQADMIPAALRVPLPTKELADLWNK